LKSAALMLLPFRSETSSLSSSMFSSASSWAVFAEANGTGEMFHWRLAWSIGADISPRMSKILRPTLSGATGVLDSASCCSCGFMGVRKEEAGLPWPRRRADPYPLLSALLLTMSLPSTE
jgi:hypothetical protein